MIRQVFKLVEVDLVLYVAWSFEVQLVVFFCSGISVALFIVYTYFISKAAHYNIIQLLSADITTYK